MSIQQILRMVWARRQLVGLTFVLIAGLGMFSAWRQPRQFSAESLLVVDARPDPVLGGLAAAASLSTQLEILRTGKVAERVVQILGLAHDPAAQAQWKKATSGKIPLETYYAGVLQRTLTVDAVRGSNIISINVSAETAEQALLTANAFARAATDVTLELRVGPARESAEWFTDQSKVLRANLEEAQARLSKFQRETGIVVSDEKMGQEVARLNALESTLVTAQAERLDASGRQRSAGSENSPDAMRSTLVTTLQTQLSQAETKLGEVSNVLGSGHPQRVQLESQIASLKQQIAVELGRVASSSTVASRISGQKVEELRAMVEAQKRQVLALRAQRDQIAVLQTDIATAQRAYDNASQRAGQLTLESQTNQTSMRLLNPATEATDTSRRKLLARVVLSLLGGLGVGAALAIGLELMNRKIRGEEDILIPGVPVVGVLRPRGGRRPIFHVGRPGLPGRSSPMLPMQPGGSS